jgi:death-on-curing protein
MHAELLAEHGGLPGPAREGSLQAALARPQHIYAHARPKPSLARLAAAYAYGIARGHCFPDGNKRLALTVLDVFLQLNGSDLGAGEPEAVDAMRALATGEWSEETLAAWISQAAI